MRKKHFIVIEILHFYKQFKEEKYSDEDKETLEGRR
jgi:hypothetical protein